MSPRKKYQGKVIRSEQEQVLRTRQFVDRGAGGPFFDRSGRGTPFISKTEGPRVQRWKPDAEEKEEQKKAVASVKSPRQSGPKPRQIAVEIRGTREEMQKIRKRIKEVKAQLAKIKAGEISPDQPYITLRYTTIEKLGESPGNYEDALREELKALKAELTRLRKQVKQKGREHYRAVTATMRKGALKSYRKMKKRVGKKLKKMEKKGGPEPGQMDEILEEISESVRDFTEILKREPSEQNIRNVALSLEDLVMGGGSMDEGDGQAGYEEIIKATETLLGRAMEAVRKDPTNPRKVKWLVKKTENAQLRSNDFGQQNEAFEIYRMAIEKQLEAAMRKAKKYPKNQEVRKKLETALERAWRAGASEELQEEGNNLVMKLLGAQ